MTIPTQTTKLRLTSFNFNYAFVVFIFATLCGCSGYSLRLHSKFYDPQSKNFIHLKPGVFHEDIMTGNHFTLERVQGEIQFTNLMLYEENTGSFTRADTGGLKIIVTLFQKDKLENNLSIMHISGAIILKDGRLVKPDYITYGDNDVCFIRNDIKIWDGTKLEIPVTHLPKRTCLTFEYSEFVSSENEFNLDVATIKNGNKLNFKFVPTIIKSHSR